RARPRARGDRPGSHDAGPPYRNDRSNPRPWVASAEYRAYVDTADAVAQPRQVSITYVVGPAGQAPRGQAALNGAALRISYGLLCRHLHRNIGRGCAKYAVVATSGFF